MRSSSAPSTTPRRSGLPLRRTPAGHGGPPGTATSVPYQQARALLELGRHARNVRQPKCAFLADHKQGNKLPGRRSPRSATLNTIYGRRGPGLDQLPCSMVAARKLHENSAQDAV